MPPSLKYYKSPGQCRELSCAGKTLVAIETKCTVDVFLIYDPHEIQAFI